MHQLRSALTTQLSFNSAGSIIGFFNLNYPFYPGIFNMQNLLLELDRHPEWLQNCSGFDIETEKCLERGHAEIYQI